MSEKTTARLAVSRAQAAQKLRALADQIDYHGALDLSEEKGPSHVMVAEDIELELELKTSPEETVLEIVLTWVAPATE